MEGSDLQGWVEAATIAEFESDDRKMVDLGGDKQIALIKTGEGIFAVSVWCSHQKASILEGDVEDCSIMCPLHGAKFDLKTGENLSLPAVRPIPAYEVKVEGERIFVLV